ncbi:MAG: hypothetical protein ISN28_08385, partial [Ectothiorhodospiraceae bacterium AqS1]|nr:hypothetical protein [Ectothiorhodospiraceae bacterium AqS1]
MGERPCTVRKYASTLKTSAILVASLVGLWLGTRPSADDCGEEGDEYGIDSIRGQGGKNIVRYEGIYNPENTNYTLDEFKTDMDSLLTSPELINCEGRGSDGTIAHLAARVGSIEGAKWAVSKGADLTIKAPFYAGPPLFTPYELALHRFGTVDNWAGYSLSEKAEWKAKFLQVATILKPPPAAATKSCADVDGQTPLPANEYCIVAENLQSSIETEVSQSLKRLIGVDYIYKAEKYLSGTALYPGYKATITFTCASRIQDCG